MAFSNVCWNKILFAVNLSGYWWVPKPLVCTQSWDDAITMKRTVIGRWSAMGWWVQDSMIYQSLAETLGWQWRPGSSGDNHHRKEGGGTLSKSSTICENRGSLKDESNPFLRVYGFFEEKLGILTISQTNKVPKRDTFYNIFQKIIMQVNFTKCENIVWNMWLRKVLWLNKTHFSVSFRPFSDDFLYWYFARSHTLFIKQTQ